MPYWDTVFVEPKVGDSTVSVSHCICLADTASCGLGLEEHVRLRLGMGVSCRQIATNSMCWTRDVQGCHPILAGIGLNGVLPRSKTGLKGYPNESLLQDALGI